MTPAMITITISDGTRRKAAADVFGPLAVTEWHGRTWAVTHVPTGSRIAILLPSATAATLAIGALMALEIDWSVDAPVVTPAQRDRIYALFERIRRLFAVEVTP